MIAEGRTQAGETRAFAVQAEGRLIDAAHAPKRPEKVPREPSAYETTTPAPQLDKRRQAL